MIQQLLIKYLIQNGRLGIPEIGAFSVKRVPAQVVAGGAEIKGPNAVIHFSTEAVSADKHLFEFLSSETGNDEVTVIGAFNEWTQELKQKISNSEVVELPFIGSISIDQDGTIKHAPFINDMGYRSVSLPGGIFLEQSIEADEEDAVEVDASWWIYAIILLLLGIAAIAYYYL